MHKQKTPLNFANFVELPENRSAFLAVRETSDLLASKKTHNPNANPLLVYGPPGVGKSHLIAALLGRVTRSRPGILVTHLDAAEFTAESQETQTNYTGVKRTERADLVIIEDLQRLPTGADQTLAFLIDTTLNHKKQIVVTAGCGPQQLQNRRGPLSPRLINRLSGGLVVRLDSPSKASRRVLLRTFTQSLTVPAEVIDWLAERLSGSVRELVGAARQLELLHQAEGALGVNRVAAQFQTQADSAAITLEKIARRVGGYFSVEPKQLISHERHRRLNTARQVTMYLSRRLTNLSLQQIGMYFGGRDHTTVLHACRKIEQALNSDASLSGAVVQLQSEL